MQAGELLDARGRLAQAGYAKKLLLTYDRASIGAAKHRIKEWDYYLVANQDYAVALTVADNSYMGLMSASLLDFRAPAWEQTTSVMTAFPWGRTKMPASSAAGDTEFHNRRCDFSFRHEGGGRRLLCRLDNFKDGKPFTCDISLLGEPEESMVIMTPFKEDKKAFYYNQKINCMPARGSALFDGERYDFAPTSSFGTLDWGRGVWTYANTWYWGSLNATVGGKPFGFNIGYGFGDTSAASENMLFYDGRAHKLEEVAFHIPQKDGKDDFLSPWRFTSSDGRFEMEFSPVLDRASYTSALVILSDQHQVFGRFSGVAVLDDGTRLELRDALGFAEKVRNQW